MASKNTGALYVNGKDTYSHHIDIACSLLVLIPLVLALVSSFFHLGDIVTTNNTLITDFYGFFNETSGFLQEEVSGKNTTRVIETPPVYGKNVEGTEIGLFPFNYGFIKIPCPLVS